MLLPVAALTIFARLYFVLLALVVGAWFYLHHTQWFAFRRWLATLPARTKNTAVWLICIAAAAAIAAYIVVFFVEIGRYPMPDSGNVLCAISKTDYGAAKKADDPSRYYRSGHVGSISQGDLALIKFSPLRGENTAANIEMLQRIVAVAGQTIEIRNGAAYTDGLLADTRTAVVSTYNITKHTPHKVLNAMRRSINREIADSSRFVTLPVVEREKHWQNYTYPTLKKNMPDTRLYPYNATIPWNALNYGPLRLPAAGDTLLLTQRNVWLYAKLISTYEKQQISFANGKALIDNQPAESYIFKLNYYFCLSDNRTTCNDSRLYGPVAESCIVGRAYPF